MPDGCSPDIHLTAYAEADREAFAGWCADAADLRFLGKSVPDARTARALFERLRDRSGIERGAVVRAVRSDGRLVGHIELKETEKTSPGEGEIVLFIARGSRGRGLGYAAVVGMLRVAGTSGVWGGVLAVCRASNRPSIRIFERLRFARGRESGPEAVWFRRALVGGA
jgi:RimJ/RimL family protein N-acetyltransferase